MEKSLYDDLFPVITDETLKNLGVTFFLFGSYLYKNLDYEKVKDIDIAIAAPPETKFEALDQIRKIARTLKRKLNWEINVYTPNSPSFGYNSCTGAPLHFFIIGQDELEVDSYFSNSIKKYFKNLTPEILDEIRSDRK